MLDRLELKLWKDGDVLGKARSYEIIEYRKKIINEICNSKEIVKLLGCENEEHPEDIIPYKYSFPHEYIPETITKTGRYINHEISANLDRRNRTYKDLSLYFFVVCHEAVIRYSDHCREYLWYDKAVCELDNLFSDKNIFGVGEMELTRNVPYSPQKNFKGRLLTFTVKDFNNGLKYGK